jgi:4-hydroxy-4-methyl-2-oxoglutarate aldolase
VVSHGTSTILEAGVTVSVCGLMVRPGDLLHGDESGLLVIPPEIAGRVGSQAKLLQAKERELVDFVRGGSFNLHELETRLSH